MGVINTGAIAKALWPGLNKIFGQSYNEWPEEWRDLFTEEKSQKAFEQEVGTSGFGLPAKKAQGDGILFDDASLSFTMQYVNDTYTLGFVVTQEAIEDNQYNLGFIGTRDSKALAFSMRQGMEVLGANVYNRAFNSSYTFGDGTELISATQPTKVGGTYSNLITVAADLSEASLEQLCIQIATATNDRGLTISLMPMSLHIHPSEMFNAERILKSTLQNDTANNAVNALRSMGAFPKGVKVNHYFTDQDAFFIRTNCPDGMKTFSRVPLSFSSDNDFNTTNVKFRARFRRSWGVTDKRGIFASPGS